MDDKDRQIKSLEYEFRILELTNDSRARKIQNLETQYNAVVAQNKSLQGELRLNKKALELMAEEVDANNTNHTYFDAENKECSAIVFYYKYALQELEAENERI